MKHIRDFHITGNDHFWIIDQSGTAIYGKIVYTGRTPEFIELEKITIPSLDVVQTLSAGEDWVVFRNMIGNIYRYHNTSRSVTQLENDLSILNPNDLDSKYYHTDRIRPVYTINGSLDIIQVLSSWKTKNVN